MREWPNNNLPPDGLLSRILDSITAEKNIKAAKKAFAYFLLSFGIFATSLTGAIFALTGWIIGSEFVRIISLILSDTGAVVANWKDFGFFVLESAPVEYLFVFFLAFFVLLLSLKYLARYFSGASRFLNLANIK
ncbi:MAG: hypothetical protein NTW60_02705 [Candidatus Wolfebacteria bacterium]|nr:hypothetical protein [Candidatus Wolfebacteria bacterium]